MASKKQPGKACARRPAKQQKSSQPCSSLTESPATRRADDEPELVLSSPDRAARAKQAEERRRAACSTRSSRMALTWALDASRKFSQRRPEHAAALQAAVSNARKLLLLLEKSAKASVFGKCSSEQPNHKEALAAAGKIRQLILELSGK